MAAFNEPICTPNGLVKRNRARLIIIGKPSPHSTYLPTGGHDSVKIENTTTASNAPMITPINMRKNPAAEIHGEAVSVDDNRQIVNLIKKPRREKSPRRGCNVVKTQGVTALTQRKPRPVNVNAGVE